MNYPFEKLAVRVEVYESGNWGKIRSYFSTLLVLSTAFGSPAFGYCIDQQFSFGAIMWLASLFTTIVILLSYKINK